MRRSLVFSILLASALIALASGQTTRNLERDKSNAAHSGKRIALVIGNGTYRHTTSLPNPVNDANDVSATLKELGFEVISGTNQTKKQIEDLIRQFGKRIADKKGVGLFFYAEHGISTGGVN